MQFDAAEARLADVVRWRRDVRHFRPDPIEPAQMQALAEAVELAPSVGNARPWRFIRVQTPALRAQVAQIFEHCNAEAAERYSDDAKRAYLALKLAGLREAPEHLAVFTEPDPDEGRGLGRQTMPQMLDLSTAMAIHTLWLVARAHNLGVGWVSILDPEAVRTLLQVPPHWRLTGYLCLGHPQSTDDTPLLHRTQWQENTARPWDTR